MYDNPIYRQVIEQLLSRYRNNFLDYFSQQLRIKTKDQQLKAFIPNPMQMRILQWVNHCLRKNLPIRIIILKARQIGGSTLSEGLLFWYCSLNSHVNGITMAHDKDTSQKLFEMCKIFYNNLNPLIRPMRRYSSKKELVFEKPDRIKKGDPTTGISLGSQIQIQTAGNVHSGTGSTTHFLHMSESGRYPFATEMKASMYPSIPYREKTFIIEESTAWGAGSEFYESCEKAQSGESTFKFFFFGWWQNPEYQIPLIEGIYDIEGKVFVLDPEEKELVHLYKCTPPQLNWRRAMLKDYEPQKFRQEYPATIIEAWQTAGFKVFDENVMSDLRETVSNPRYVGRIDTNRLMPIYENHPEMIGYLSVWEIPKNSLTYDIGVDVSLGSEGGDFTAICVIERDTKRVVALWKGLIDPFDAALEAEKIGNFYNVAQINCEVNSIGYATNGKLSETYCVDPDTRILTQDLRWIKASEIKLGDNLFGIDEEGDKKRVGFRYCHPSIVEAIEYRNLPKVKVITEHTSIVVSENHPFLVRRKDFKKRNKDGKFEYGRSDWIQAVELNPETDEIVFIGATWDEPKTWESGILSAAMDGEGSLVLKRGTQGGKRSDTGLIIQVCQRKGLFLDRILETLKHFKYEVGIGNHPNGTNKDVFNIIINGGFGEKLRFLGQIRPIRLLEKYKNQWADMAFPKPQQKYLTKVIRVEKLGAGEVIGIQTSTKTFLSEGLVSHNSNLYRWKIRDEQVLKLTRKTGYETTHRSKKYLVSLARTLLRLRPPIRSKFLFEELTVYVDYGEDFYRAAPGFNDDCVQSYMLALVASDDEKTPNFVEGETDEEEGVVVQSHQRDDWDPEDRVETEKNFFEL